MPRWAAPGGDLWERGQTGGLASRTVLATGVGAPLAFVGDEVAVRDGGGIVALGPGTRASAARSYRRLSHRWHRPSTSSLPTAVWSTHICVESIEETITRTERARGAILVGPLEAGSAGRQAVLADADGVPFCIWQPGDRTGAQLVNEPGSGAMSSLHTPSSERAEAFYTTVFGWKLEAQPHAPTALWRLPGYVGGPKGQPMPPDVVAVMTPIEDPTEIPPHWAVNFRVEDVDVVAERATGLGGTLVMPPMTTPRFRSAVIADPSSGVIAVSAPLIR